MTIKTIQKKLSEYKPKKIQEPLPEAAVLIPITNSTEPSFVLTQRSETLNSHPGEVCFPGGKRDEQDKNLLETAFRESFEEIGLHDSNVNIIGVLDDMISFYGLKVTPYIGLIPPESTFQINKKELDSIFRVPLEFFLQRKTYRFNTIHHNGYEYHLHHFDFKEYDIWGLTAIFIMYLLNITLNADFDFGPNIPGRYLRKHTE